MAQNKENQAGGNAITKSKHIYMYTPIETAKRSGRSAVDSFGEYETPAPEPIALVVYMNWKDIAEELKQFSRVTASTDESPSSANSMSTH